MTAAGRRAAALTLTVLGGLVTVLAVLVVYAAQFFVSGDGFAGKVAEAVRQPAVSKELAVRLTGALEGAVPNAVVARRPLEDTASSLISNGTFDPIVRRAALVLHGALLSSDAKNVSLDLADGLQLLNSFVSTQEGARKGQVRAGARAPVADVRKVGIVGAIADSADLIRALAWVLPLLALALFAAAVVVSVDRGRALGRVGFAVAAAGVAVFIIENIAVKVRLQGFEQSDAVDQALGVFLGGLVVVAIALVFAGGLLAAAGSGRFATGVAGRAFGHVWGFLRAAPATTGPRVARALLLLVLGVLLMVWPLPTVETLALIAGFFVTVEGLTEVIALLGGASRTERTRAGRVRRGVLVGGLVVLGLLATSVVIQVNLLKPSKSDAGLAQACNGSELLCDRPLDAVAFPAAHNAMSSANAGFIDPNQRNTIVQQLDAGVRGLLIDSLMARPTARRASALTVLDGEVRRQAEAEVGPGGITALQDFLGRRVAKPTGPPEPFLCHMACELGAIPMVTAMRDVRTWLDAHPREVLQIVIQDLVTPRDTERVFKETGLLDRVYTWRPGTPAPTLRQMIAQNRRVLVMAEDEGIPGSWYPPGYRRLLKETPYDNKTVASLRSRASCVANRGREANPLFLVNHWAAVYPPLPSKAQEVNAERFMLARVRRCSRIRNAFPNLIAVDFADIGDVVRVAARVNGVRTS